MTRNEIFKELDHIQYKCAWKDWGSYEETPVTKNVVGCARSLLAVLTEQLPGPDEVAPLCYGAIEVQWSQRSGHPKNLSLEIGEDVVVITSWRDDDDIEEAWNWHHTDGWPTLPGALREVVARVRSELLPRPGKNPTVWWMLESKLTELGYDGLYNAEAGCACGVDALVPCDGCHIHECRAGYWRPSEDELECRIGPDKPETEETKHE